ncbi:glycoside hydrolase family 9 protein [Carboxylicivirga marina]|uniref:glycoside hydrolase family 9 protein n=1 Tax=Carboxylicivirga marina TaxID=2800988 RepID=UPI00259794E1|nr:glycoside hydrolase family 9 protein [uncultured Carboxylicivirga sp.]
MFKSFVYITVLYFVLSHAVVQIQAQHLNQYAYHPQSVKHVFLPKAFGEASFKVLNGKGEEVLVSETPKAKAWEFSGTEVTYADVTEVSADGSYRLLVDGMKHVIDFKIDNKAYNRLGTDLLKSYYMARATEPILEKHAGIYARQAGHPDDKVKIHTSAAGKNRPAESTISSPGGWYDAGDYGKYIVNSGITTYTLLHLYELFPEHLKTVNTNIPESSDKTADILNEILVNLRWMLSMQDPNDGGVYHKLTTKSFCGMIMPHKDTGDRYVVMKTTAATCDFAAVMSKAARILKHENKGLQSLAQQCIKAAERAWEWTLANPNIMYVQPEDITTGQYDDKNIADEKFWAATELFLATGKKAYKKEINFEEQKFMRPEWRRVNTLGLLSLMADNTYGSKLNKQQAQQRIIKLANKLYRHYNESAYKISINKFPWGSNGEVMNDGMLLINAYVMRGDDKYLHAADACISYVLGANPLNKCFVTGYGTNRVMFLHDRRCDADGIEAPIPGLLSGGPTNTVQNDCGSEIYGTKLPAMSYVDKVCNYSTNEVAINWNSPAIFTVLALDAIYSNKNNK